MKISINQVSDNDVVLTINSLQVRVVADEFGFDATFARDGLPQQRTRVDFDEHDEA